MIRHHPDNNMLLEYSSGSLPWAMSLAVSAHLQLCPQCRQQRESLNDIGGALLSESAPQTIDTDAFSKLMGRIDAAEQQTREEERLAGEMGEPTARPQRPVRHTDPILSDLPKVIRKLISRREPLKWKRVSNALRTSRLTTGQDRYEVAFQRICRGGQVAEHDHRGREVTVVLVGSFSDADGVYRRGDFLVREPGDVHRPIATQDQECLCLSVVEAPVKVTGLLGWLVNPFLSFRPA
ncbi:transcriptional regulator [Microbulbifer flavimaris]|uniref:Transcriptional regulator n=1 Tax=Microbulbifer flavimaris TaxID=1781068 RepID=A0ABX4I4F7_9GAMM|nr:MULTISPECIES: ChrR family anti-sigma-E factor [Microbulbifer]PCO06663.1 transcriptional regulator [Microbulbifer flavimaris]